MLSSIPSLLRRAKPYLRVAPRELLEQISPTGRAAPQDANKPTIIITGMSRSGTTLLNVLLDAHPDVAMCYDVAPKPVRGSLSDIRSRFAAALDEVGRERLADLDQLQTYRGLRKHLIAGGDPELGWSVIAFRRSGITALQFESTLKAAAELGLSRIETRSERLTLAGLAVESKRRSTDLQTAGLKLVMAPPKAAKHFSCPRFVCIVRDPRDVYASHVKRDWDMDVPSLTMIWNRRMQWHSTAPDRQSLPVHLLRFEDLVAEPRATVRKLFRFANLSDVDVIDDFAERADVFKIKGAFNEKSQLFWGGSISAGKIGQWKNFISAREVSRIERRCGPFMRELGYL